MSTPASHGTQRKRGQILISGVNQEGSTELGAAPDPTSVWLFPTHLQHPRPAGAHGTARPWRGSPGRDPTRGSGSAGAALLRALSPDSEDLHGSAPLPPPILPRWGLPRPCPSRWGNVTLAGLAAGARLGDPVVRRSRLAAALWSGCGRSQKNVSYYCLFLPGFSPPLPANKAFPIAEHTATTSLPSSRSPGPSSILVAFPRLLLPPRPSPSAFPPSFPVSMANPMPWYGHGHHHCIPNIPRFLAGAQLVALAGVGTGMF